jgi:hypothetical protein
LKKFFVEETECATYVFGLIKSAYNNTKGARALRGLPMAIYSFADEAGISEAICTPQLPELEITLVDRKEPSQRAATPHSALIGVKVAGQLVGTLQLYGHTCFECGAAVPRRVCSGCWVAVFCDAGCSARHWTKHKAFCKAAASVLRVSTVQQVAPQSTA